MYKMHREKKQTKWYKSKNFINSARVAPKITKVQISAHVTLKR